MYSTDNKKNSVVAERIISTLKSKIFKHMTAISKNVYFDVLDDIIKKYNNTVHRTTGIKPIDVTYNFYVEYIVDSNEEDRKFKAGDHLRTARYKSVLTKEYTPNW